MADDAVGFHADVELVLLRHSGIGREVGALRSANGLDVVVSAVSFKALGDQLRLLGPLKAAGVKRFVPCFYGTAAPRGAMHLLDSVRFPVLAF